MSGARERVAHDWRLYTVIFLAYLAIGSFGPLVPELKRELGLSTTALGAVIAAYGFARLTVSLPVGRLAARGRQGPLLAGGSVLLVLAHGGSAVAGNGLGLAFCQAMAGVGSAFCHVTSLAVLAMRARRHESGRVMGAYYTATFGGLALAGPIAGSLAAVLGWRLAFWWAATMALAALGVVLAGSDRPAPGPGEATAAAPASGAAAGSWRGPGIWPIYLLHFTALFLFAGARTTLVPVYAASAGRLPVALIGTLLGAGALVTLGSLFLAGVLADRLGKLRLVAAGLALSAMGMLLLVGAPGLARLVGGLFLLDLGQGLLAGNAAALLADLVPASGVGTAMGVMRVMADLGFLTGPLILGATADHLGYDAAFGAAALVPLASLALLARLARPRP